MRIQQDMRHWQTHHIGGENKITRLYDENFLLLLYALFFTLKIGNILLSGNSGSDTTAETTANMTKKLIKDGILVPPKEATEKVADLQGGNLKETAEDTATIKWLNCDECEFWTENVRGLKTHISRMHKIPQGDGFDDLDLKYQETQTGPRPILFCYGLQDYIDDEVSEDSPGYGCERWFLIDEYYCDPKNYYDIMKDPYGFYKCAGKLRKCFESLGAPRHCQGQALLVI